MRQFFTAFCLTLCLLLTQQESFAQPNQSITLRYNWYNYINPQPDWSDWKDVFDNGGSGVEVAWNRRLDKHAWLSIPGKFGTALRPGRDAARGRDLLVNLDALVQYYLFREGAFLRPSVHLGIGSTWNVDDEAFDFNLPAGLGLNFRIAPSLYVNVQSQYRFSIENRPGWHHGVGGTVYFGGAPELPPPPPDRDGDGTPDVTDHCPDVPGMAALMGCPDRDGDGIADADDRCPDVPGTAALMGCPDRDNDGITDTEDDCPDQAGLPNFRGCPDTDGDGIPDNLDRCPREPGIAALQGCPVRDRDNDGIADADDDCPDQAGPAALRGCPDRDGDGVPDKDDRCPDKPGPVSNKGCPEIKAEDKAKLERAVKLVQFQTGKATLLQKSYPVLDEVVSVMKQYPEYSLNINGHTDATGDDKMNQALSEKRAKTCYDYLVSKGVATGRIAHAGYGETRPVADNKTAAGREKNRRVEFELYVK